MNKHNLTQIILMYKMATVLRNLVRKCKYTPSVTGESKYIRCLSTLDLSVLGIGTVVGSGLYVVVGKLARDTAGPAVIISFAIAAMSAFLSGLCYAEFGSRIPKAGSAYVYVYEVMGELWAFVAGWNMILEYIIAASSIARACSENINSLSGGEVYHFFMEYLNWWDSPVFGRFPDLLALLLVLLLGIITGLGVRHTAIFNKTVTFVNYTVIIFAICAGAYYAEASNWSSWESFAPYGIQGIVAAAGSCFYAFVGFDVVATAGEEATNPKVGIPRAFFATIVVSFLAYFGVSTILTLMFPYYELDKFAPLAEAFAHEGFVVGKYVVAVGAVFATLGSLITTSFSAPRIISAMAADGLLFKWLGEINERTRVPLRALCCSTFVIGVLTVILDLEQLVEMLSVGTLTAYSLVAASVLLIRYQCDVESVYVDSESIEDVSGTRDEANKVTEWLKGLSCCKAKDTNAKYEKLHTSENSGEPTLLESEKVLGPTEKSSFHASIATFVLTVALFVLCTMVSRAKKELVLLKAWAILLTCLSGVTVLAAVVFISRQPRNSASFPFTVPCVPLVPVLTLFINIVLIVNVNYWTYVRFIVWMVLGFLIYGCYGYKNSNQGNANASKTRMKETNE